MEQAVGIKEVSYVDCAGGGQVVVQGNVAYVGNMSNPDGTTIVDVSDPRNPRIISRLGMVPGTHSHKVRVHIKAGPTEFGAFINSEITRWGALIKANNIVIN